MHRQTWHVQHVTTAVGQIFIRYREGKGLPLILWPSIFCDNSLYSGMVEWLENPVILVDGPGHGTSHSCPANLTMALCGQAMNEILKELRIPTAVTIGTSWGGLVAIEQALQDTEGRVRGLVLANTPFTVAGSPSLSARLIVLLTRLIPTSRLFRESVARNFFGSQTATRHPEVIRNFLQQSNTFAHPDLHTVIRMVMLKRASVTPKLPSLPMPTLVLAGELDKLYSTAQMQAEAGAIPHHRFEVIPASGHLSPAERPHETAQRISGWLNATFPAHHADPVKEARAANG